MARLFPFNTMRFEYVAARRTHGKLDFASTARHLISIVGYFVSRRYEFVTIIINERMSKRNELRWEKEKQKIRLAIDLEFHFFIFFFIHLFFFSISSAADSLWLSQKYNEPRMNAPIYL